MKFVNKNILLSLKIICNDNAAIVFIFLYLLYLLYLPQKEKYYATGTNEHKRAHETGAQGA